MRTPQFFVQLHEQKPISATLSKVTASIQTLVPMDKDAIYASLCESMPSGVAPIQASFIDVGNQTYVGFVTSRPEFRLMSDPKVVKSVRAGRYKVMAANIYMDTEDESLWDVQEGVGGKFLCRQGTDNLASLVEASRKSPVGGVMRMAQIASVRPETNEFVSFIRKTPTSHEVDYGVVVASAQGKHAVLSMASKDVITITPDLLIASVTLEKSSIPPLPAKAVQRLRASNGNVLTPVEYWKQVYSYSPEYLNEVLKQVEAMSYA